ncbi:hypothetical protein O7632_27100 [Solwaraspora sp. WMMD406]|uniref:hypothetical protein n=1 Tax=Solwaraspora sp. WMMD406 TaxID=3016095 RepID=UPI0024168802|nr:hypothetical protein [Solwaraspora sp. WMMD406]MDG4767734.1 hypothetical protein [Solwaraspora sp. WMMD406]
MSEYQFYEFLAVDRPLGHEQLAELRKLSDTARITPTSFTDSCHGDTFAGDVTAMVEAYFDGFLQLTSSGSRQLALRLPARLLDLATAQRYCWADPADAYQAGEHVVLTFGSDDPDEEKTLDGDGWLASIVGVRQQLAAGDHRALYLAWLAAIQSGEFGDDATEPPVPAGLADLTADLRNLADFLRLDPLLLDVAAEHSASVDAAGPDPDEVRDWVTRLPDGDTADAVIRLLGVDGHLVRAELLRRFRSERGQPQPTTSGTRTVGDLLDAAETARSAI